MASKNKKAAGANHFALLETNDPGDTLLEQPQAPANLTQELFGRAYPSAWEVIRSRQQKQQYNSAPPANAKAPADSEKNGAQGQGSSAKKQQGGRHAKGAAVNDNGDAPAPRLYSLAEFPSLKQGF